MNQILKLIILSALISSTASNVYAEPSHDHQENEQASTIEDHSDHDEHDDSESHDEEEGDHDYEGAHGARAEGETDSVALSPLQTAFANIKVVTLKARAMDYKIYAPGEIKANGYTSYLVSPRVDSVVLRRHVALGDHVEKGQPLVTLFSETVADAQAAYRVAGSEWQRVKQLGRKAVGDKRFVAAKADYDAAYARLLAYGLSEDAIQSPKNSQALGEYSLIAAIAGAVLSDDFHQGQRVESGEALIELADEHELWVEARMAPTEQLELPAGTQAQVKVGAELFAAKVTQEAHTIDPLTRTRVVRLLVDNDSHRLHPGLFADVYFSFATKTPVLAVPESALMRGADGDWTVFVEVEPGQFNAQEVELRRSFGKWREIEGIPSGSRVVMEGAFFVASQIAKGGFDPHNH